MAPGANCGQLAGWYARTVVVEFDEREQAILAPYFTNLDGNVFALRNLPEVVKGALFSRYSRSSKSLRRTFLDEFVHNDDLNLQHLLREGDQSQVVAAEKAEQFYERVLVGYGDDSVAELGGAHVALEGITALAAKEIEDSRIGLSPLEKSTRYVFFDKQVEGRFEYLQPAEIMRSPLAGTYVAAMDSCFQAYADLIEPLTEDLKAAFPPEAGVSERAYRAAIRAKAADVLRSLLPVGHFTNMGVFGNGRAFEYLLIKMAASPLTEVRELGHKLSHELALVIPAFTKRAGTERGRDHAAHLRQREIEAAMFVPGLTVIGEEDAGEAPVTIVDFDPDGEVKVVASLLYPHSGVSLGDLRESVRRMSIEDRRKVLSDVMQGRGSRHKRPPRAFEMADYTVEFNANFGVYKDLQRHRMSTQQRQRLSTRNGFTLPPELAKEPYEARFRECMTLADQAYRALFERFPFEAQYVVPTAYRMRWTMKMNLREIAHMTELRSTIQGHPDYRAVVHDLTLQVRTLHPVLAELATEFVDFSEVDLARLKSEQRIDERAIALAAEAG